MVAFARSNSLYWAVVAAARPKASAFAIAMSFKRIMEEIFPKVSESDEASFTFWSIVEGLQKLICHTRNTVKSASWIDRHFLTRGAPNLAVAST